MRKTYYYRKKLTATTTEQLFRLPRLKNFSILNAGNEDATIEFDGNISANSAPLNQGVTYNFGRGLQRLFYKVGQNTSDLWIIGELEAKAENT